MRQSMHAAASFVVWKREGRREGQRDERVAILRRLVSQSQISIDQALDMIGIPEKEQPLYKKMLHTTV